MTSAFGGQRSIQLSYGCPKRSSGGAGSNLVRRWLVPPALEEAHGAAGQKRRAARQDAFVDDHAA